MTEETMNKISAIKNNFNFGVEVEMAGITRKNAAKLAAHLFNTGKYKNTHAQNDFMTWSAWDGQGREWKFSRDCSIQASSDDERCELITPILEYGDIHTLLEVLAELKNHGAVSGPAHECGVHIHVSRKGGFEAREIRNLVSIMASHEAQIGRAIKIDERRTGEYCKTIDPDFLEKMLTRKPFTLEMIENIWYEAHGRAWRTDYYHTSRYHMLNLHSLFHGHGTVEFRLFQFSDEKGIDIHEMEAYIQLCLGMCQLAHDVKHASAKPQQIENEKYALRCWLLRLGFIGDEFKNAREVLMKNMNGNSAWRKAG